MVALAATHSRSFRLVRQQTDVADFLDDDEVRRAYYPEAEALAEAETGAGRLVVFHHGLRIANDEVREVQETHIRPERKVHIDYTEWTAPQRVRERLPEQAATLLRSRLAVIDVCSRSTTPVESFPLALCDARIVSHEDIIVCERRHPDRIGQSYTITYNPGYRWYWFPHMQCDEAPVFKTYDWARTVVPDGHRMSPSTTRPHHPPCAVARERRDWRLRVF